MSNHSNRSPSPLSSRPTNPNLRNSENNPPNRRSFSGNKSFSKPSVLTNSRLFDPTTPANSPDITSRRSFVEEKENCEKEDVLKPSKLQSPAKGSKHFMSPTISAASKFTPSPRKKVLVERNDPVRTSISLSEGKAMFFSSMSSNVSEHFDSKSETGKQNQKIEGLLDSKVVDSVKSKAVHEVHPISKPSKRVSFSDVPAEIHLESESLSESVITDSNCLKFDSVATDSDSLKLDSSLKNEVDSPSIAPLDADPLPPPYDPKSNYLSPRPQFLLYKPNPRIEILLNKEKGVDPEEFKRLQDNLMEEIMSENFSDSSEASEESHTEDSSSQIEEIEVTASTDDLVIGMDEMEEDNHVSESPESLPISTSINDVVSEEDLVQKNGKKPRALFRLMCFSTLLMLFFVAFVSISALTYSPHEFVQKDLILSDLSNLYHQSRAAAKVNFDRFSARVYQLKTSTVSYLSELGKGGKQAPMQFVNLSDIQVENAWSGGFFVNKRLLENLGEDELEENLDAEIDTFEEDEYEEIDSDEKEYDVDAWSGGFFVNKRLLENLGEDELEENLDAEIDTFEEDEYEEIDSDEKEYDVEEVAEMEMFGEEEAYDTFEKRFNAEEETSHDTVKSADKSESEHSQDTQIQRELIDTKPWDDQKTVDQSASGLEAPLEGTTDPASSAHTETVDQSPSALEAPLEGTTDPASSACTDTVFLDHKSGKSDVNALSEEGVQSALEDNSFAHKAMRVSSLLAALLAAAAFMYHYKRKQQPCSSPMLSKEAGNGLTSTKQHYVHQEKEYSQNWQTEGDENGSELCPSEMSSSFQKCASYSSKRGAANEVVSSERKARKIYKRESLASSSGFSTGSPSYGSFTTYERIPIKHGNGEEEIITPVRRSSRIRKHHDQVTSP